MLGVLRTLLAVLVMINHIPGNHAPFSYSAMAVIGFFFISGYLMQKSYARFRQNSNHPAISFYTDRIFRLLPLYLVAILLGIILVSDYQNLALRDYAINLSLVFLPFFYLRDSFQLIDPPTWSLGAEFTFYALVPAIFFATRYRFLLLFVGIALAALHIWGMSYDGQIYDKLPQWAQWLTVFGYDKNALAASDILAYRGPFFAISVFLLGAIVASGKLLIATAIYCMYLIFFMITGQFGNGLDNTYAIEVVLGILILAPALAAAATSQLLPKAIDTMIGRLSYPIFIFHHPIIDCANQYGIRGQLLFILVVCSTLVLSVAGAWFQNIIDKYRIQIRGFSSLRAPERAAPAQKAELAAP